VIFQRLEMELEPKQIAFWLKLKTGQNREVS